MEMTILNGSTSDLLIKATASSPGGSESDPFRATGQRRYQHHVIQLGALHEHELKGIVSADRNKKRFRL